MLRNFTRVELHLHLDCSLSYQVVSILNPGVTRQEYELDYRAPPRCTNLAEFLSRAQKGFQLMQTEQSLRLVTEDLFRQLSDDGVIYAEIRFAPLLHTGKGLTPERVIRAVDRTVEEMIRVTGIEGRLILCTLRHFKAAQSAQTAKLVKAFMGSRVTGFDIAGDEAGFPLTEHVGAYHYARENGLFCTAHAGEALGPNSVWRTLELLQPSRIGHGVRSVEDPELVAHLRRRRIHLEVCPSSNIQIIESIPSWEGHPIDRLYRAGVPLNINTDTRMLTPTTLTAEYEGVQRTFGWSAQHFLQTNLMATDAAFVDGSVKESIRSNLQRSYSADIMNM